MVELFTGFPIFPGESESEQLLCIMEYIGIPSKEILLKSTRKKLFFDAENMPKILVNSKGKKRFPGTRRFVDTLRNADERFVALAEACFDWDPFSRITPQQALISDWILDQPNAKDLTKNFRPSSTRRQNAPKSFLFA